VVCKYFVAYWLVAGLEAKSLFTVTIVHLVQLFGGCAVISFYLFMDGVMPKPQQH
jgi:hypothetical protein